MCWRLKQALGEKPDSSCHGSAVIDPVGSGNTEDPQHVAYGLAVCVAAQVVHGEQLTATRPGRRWYSSAGIWNASNQSEIIHGGLDPTVEQLFG